MENTRQKKVSRLLQKEVAEMFQRELHELLHGAMLSVTVSRATPDMSLVKLYVSIFPEGKAAEVLASIEENKAKVRYALGKRIGKQMRIVPELNFYLDDSMSYMDNIDRLLKEDKDNAVRPD
jgi:ribosome-binding factor A